MKVAARLLSLILCIIITAGMLPAFIAAEGKTSATLTAAISDNGKYVELVCTLPDEAVAELKGKKLSLYTLSPSELTADLSSLTPDETNITPLASFNVRVLLNGSQTYAFVLTSEDESGNVLKITPFAYITNHDKLSSRTFNYPSVASKKGLDIQLMADAELLGVKQTVISVALNEYLSNGADDSIKITHNGKTYYINSAKLATLDHKVKVYSDSSIRVYLNFVLTSPADSSPSSVTSLYCEGRNEGASYFALNMSSSDTADTLYAFTHFMLDRYTGGDTGFCGSVILGYEVNSNRNTNSAGDKALSAYVSDYASAYRIVDAAARSVYANAKVFISVANNFNVTSKTDSADPLLDYPARDFIDRFAAKISSEGDLPWLLAINPYNENMSDASFRGTSDDTFSAGYITMDNIGTLTTYLSQPDFLYNGTKRGILISELGFTGGGNSVEAQRMQAAAYSLAYYKAEANDQIEGLIYHRHVDSSKETLNFGLYTRADGTNATPESKKLIYTVFRYIDSDSSRTITEQYLPVIGVISWGEAVTGFNQAEQTKRITITGTGTTSPEGAGILNRVKITDFISGTNGFYPAYNSRLVRTESDSDIPAQEGVSVALKSEMYSVAFCEYRGISKIFSESLLLPRTRYITFCVKPLAPAGAATANSTVADIIVRLLGRDSAGTEVVYEGSAQLTCGAYYELSFDISELLEKTDGEIDAVNLWIKPHTVTENGEYGLSLYGIYKYSEIKEVTFGSVIKIVLAIIGAVITLAALIYGVLFLNAYIKHKKKQKAIEEKRRRSRSKK